jgi:hypothetical protein
MARRAAALRFPGSCFGGALLPRPGDERAVRPGGRGHLRASHADREQVIGALKAAFVAGMLDKDDFDRRVSRALVPRTYAELADLTADLPAGLAAAAPKPTRRGSGQPLLRPVQIITGSTMLYGGAWLYAPSPRASALVVLGGFFYLCILAIALAVALENRQGKPSGSGCTDTHLAWAPPPARGGQLPPGDSGHRHADAAARRRHVRSPLPRCTVTASARPSQPGHPCNRVSAARPAASGPHARLSPSGYLIGCSGSLRRLEFRRRGPPDYGGPDQRKYLLRRAFR